MKILFLANRVPFPIRDGQSRRTYHILTGLARAHDVHLLSLCETEAEASRQTVERLERFCAHVELLPAPSKKPGLAMGSRLLRSVVSRDPYTIWRHYSREYLRAVRHRVQSSRFDVVHCDILPLAYTLRGLHASFVALTNHDVSHEKARRLARERHNPASKLFIHYEAAKLKRLERRVCRDVDLIVAVSERDRRAFEHLCPSGRFAVVDNGVDVATFTPDPRSIEPYSLVWVGGFHHYPNYEAVRSFLESAYPAIKQTQPNVKLYVVGGEPPERLMRLAAHDPSVTFTGYVDDPVKYLQRGAVFVAPILSGGGTKLKLLEAMAAGKAIVSTTIGVEGIEGEDGEHFVIADEWPRFAARVTELLNDAAHRDRLGTNARRLVQQKYDWDAICTRMCRLYEEAAAG